jgi:hypothetical protein
MIKLVLASLIVIAMTALLTSQTVVAKKFEILGGPGGIIVPAGKNKHHNDDNNRVKIKGSIPISTTPRYIDGTVIDCNLVFSFSTYFSQLAIDSCNQQYRK